MATDPAKTDLDRELAHLPPEARWREWMLRIEAVLFASAGPVSESALARLVGRDVAVSLLLGDLAADMSARAYEPVEVAGGWMLRTRPRFAAAIHAAADVTEQGVDLRQFDAAVLAAVAYHQPVTRQQLRDIFGTEIDRDVIVRLRKSALITTGPRAPRRGAPHTFVTTEQFLTVFGLRSLHDLPDPEGPGDG